MELSALLNLGLTQTEAAVFATLSRYGSLTAGNTSRKVSAHRSRVYEALDSLAAQGLIKWVIVNGVKTYSAAHPEKLQARIDTYQSELNLLLPKLKPVTQTNTKVSAHQGIRSIKNLLEVTLEHENYLVFGAPMQSLEKLGETYWKNYNQKAKAKNIQSRMIFNQELTNWSAEIASINPFTQIRFLERPFENLTETFILPNQVILILWTEEPVGIQVSDEIAAKSYAQFFELMWNQAIEVSPQ